jgi:hypothetical protein
LDYDSEDFWIGYGENIRELYFKNGLLRKEEFVNVLKYTPNLEVMLFDPRLGSFKIDFDYFGLFLIIFEYF